MNIHLRLTISNISINLYYYLSELILVAPLLAIWPSLEGELALKLLLHIGTHNWCGICIKILLLLLQEQLVFRLYHTIITVVLCLSSSALSMRMLNKTVPSIRWRQGELGVFQSLSKFIIFSFRVLIFKFKILRWQEKIFP
jgi:hypothetical protein